MVATPGCIKHWPIDAVTEKDVSRLLMTLQEVDTLGRAKYFSMLDLK